MGQKVNPIGLRLGITKTWDSRWYAEKFYSRFLQEDILLRKFIKKKLYHAGISKIEIDRTANRAKITIRAARPGIGAREGVPESIGEEDGTDLYRHSPTGNSSIDRNAVKAPSGRWRPNREK